MQEDKKRRDTDSRAERKGEKKARSRNANQRNRVNRGGTEGKEQGDSIQKNAKRKMQREADKWKAQREAGLMEDERIWFPVMVGRKKQYILYDTGTMIC